VIVFLKMYRSHNLHQKAIYSAACAVQYAHLQRSLRCAIRTSTVQPALCNTHIYSATCAVQYAHLQRSLRCAIRTSTGAGVVTIL